MHPNKTSHLKFQVREWAILGLFSLLTILMLYPLSINLTSMVPESTDPLLNAWRMQWVAHAFLSGPDSLANLFSTNIFYPFPLTLAYSEHFLMLSALALPFLLVPDSHLVGMNLSVLVTFVLSGYAMYLLVTTWTQQRWAGLVIGVLFAFSPHRFGQLNHLELLVTQWLPLTLLALHWTLTRPGLRYPILFGLFFNLQALSGFHFSLNLTIACALLALVYALSGHVYWRPGLGVAAFLSILITLLFNWPVWQMYLRFSDNMGAIRTPGEVRIYSAALTDYLTAIPYNWLYGWTFGRWQSADHQFQPLLPFGLVGFFLALVGLLAQIPKLKRIPGMENREWRIPHPPFHIPYPSPLPTTVFLSLLILLSLLLSFGLNEEALGPNLAPLLKYSPYAWLYDHVAFFQGIRVPGRFGILVVIGLAGLAGGGTRFLLSLMPLFGLSRSAECSEPKAPCGRRSLRTKPRLFASSPPTSRLTQPTLVIGLIALILLEAWSVPLVGPEIPNGPQLPPVYSWLQTQTAPDTVVLELPYQDASEFKYEYYSSYHWRRLVNGGTGFTPPIYKEMRQWFKSFPDARSVDIIQHLGVDRVILHSAAYKPEEWQRLLSDLPFYLPAFTRVNQLGEALILQVAHPLCPTEPDQVRATLTPTMGPDGLSNAVQVTYHNAGPAAFVANVQQVSHLTFADQTAKNFTEPLVTPAGKAQSILVPLLDEQQTEGLTGAWLATLNRTASVTELTSEVLAITSPLVGEKGPEQWQPLGLKFAQGPQLLAYRLSPETPTVCSKLTVALKWTSGQTGDTATVQLLDPFGRVVSEDLAQPWLATRGPSAQPTAETIEVRDIPLPGSLPAGRYGLRIYVRTHQGQERLPMTAEGVTLPTDQIPPLPLVIHPMLYPATQPEAVDQPIWGGVLRLINYHLEQTEVAAGDWLRFSLIWQADRPISGDWTMFTQLIGPDGRVWGQHDNQPKGGWYRTSLWPPGQPVADDYAFQIGAEAPPGIYHLITGMYDSTTLERWPVQTAAGTSEDFVEIGTVRVSRLIDQRVGQ